MTCVLACKQENLTRPGLFWNKILELQNETYDHITYFRHASMHCDNPVCVEACQSEAITFGDLDDPESPIRAKLWQSKQLLAEQGTRPKVSYIASIMFSNPQSRGCLTTPKWGKSTSFI